jgi:chromosome segregation ATPase
MLQSQLDSKTVELINAQKALEQQNKENTDTKQKIHIIASKEESYERRLHEREREIEELKKHIQFINKELHDYKEMANIKTHDTNQLSNDVDMLTRENHAVKELLVKTSDEKEYFKIELESTTGRVKQMQQSMRALELEKGDLQTSYREVCNENKRLKESVNHMNYQGKDSDGKINSLERDLQGAQMVISQFEEKEQQLIYEIQQYDNNVTILTQQLEASQQEIIQAREARDNLLRDHEAQRSLSYNSEVSKEELHRYVRELENHKNILECHLDELQRDLNLQRDRTEYERQRYFELEAVLNRERIEMQYVDNERQSLRHENDKLQSTIKKPDSYLMRRSDTYSEQLEEESSCTRGSSNKSYDTRNNINLQKIMSQLESEIIEKRSHK